MAKDSKIGWTHNTQNFWWGCNKVSAECEKCYIKNIMKRAGREPFKGPIRTKTWSEPAKWNREAAEMGIRLRVFTCSMSDYFHPGADKWRPEAWEIIKQCTNLDWLILTKRPELVIDRLPSDWGTGYGHTAVFCQIDAGDRRTLARQGLGCFAELFVPSRVNWHRGVTEAAKVVATVLRADKRSECDLP